MYQYFCGWLANGYALVFASIQAHPALPQMVYNTLLELYVGEIGSCPTEEKKAKEERALSLLKRQEVCMYKGQSKV